MIDPALDAQLARAGRDGDPAAFAVIYRRFAPLVATTARRLLRDSADIDDVVQETFLIVFEQLDRLVEPAALRRWIARIAVSRACRRFRSRTISVDDSDAVLERQISADASPEQRAELAMIVALELPPKVRMAWLLRRVIGASLDDIAAQCACSLATVKRRLVEAEAMIARHVEVPRDPSGQPSPCGRRVLTCHRDHAATDPRANREPSPRPPGSSCS